MQAAQISTPVGGTTADTIPTTEWELDLTVTDAPRVLPTACDTSDGCESSCASACTSD